MARKGGVDAGAQKGPMPSRKTVENVLKAVSCSSCWSWRDRSFFATLCRNCCRFLLVDDLGVVEEPACRGLDLALMFFWSGVNSNWCIWLLTLSNVESRIEIKISTFATCLARSFIACDNEKSWLRIQAMLSWIWVMKNRTLKSKDCKRQ